MEVAVFTENCIFLADFLLKENDFEKLSLEYWEFLFFLVVFFVTGYTYKNNYE